MNEPDRSGAYDGWIDGIVSGQIFGWCRRSGSSDRVSLEFFADGVCRSLVTTGQRRPGIGDGQCGFLISMQGSELHDEATIEVRIADTGQPLNCRARTLGALRAIRTGPPDPAPPCDPDIVQIRTVLNRFESLGYNCEFGLVQRHFAVEGIGLLRWGSFWDGLPGLIRAVSGKFAGVGDFVSVYPHGREFISLDETYRLVFHTNQQVGAVEPAQLIKNERIRIAYLAEKLIEDIETGAKIFVYKSSQDVSPDRARATRRCLADDRAILVVLDHPGILSGTGRHGTPPGLPPVAWVYRPLFARAGRALLLLFRCLGHAVHQGSSSRCVSRAGSGMTLPRPR